MRRDVEAASDAMKALDLLDRCSVLALPLLEDRAQTVKAISALLATVMVLARRLDDQEQLAIAVQLAVEARRLAQDWMN